MKALQRLQDALEQFVPADTVDGLTVQFGSLAQLYLMGVLL